MTTIITLAALWILRFPIFFIACLIISAIAWTFRLIGKLLDSDAMLSMVVISSVVGTYVYFTSYCAMVNLCL